MYADIYINHINLDEFRKLGQYKCYRAKRNRSNKEERFDEVDHAVSITPEFDVFMIILVNRSIHPLKIKNITSSYNSQPPIPAVTEQTSEYKSYDYVDISQITKIRRLLSSDKDFKDIHFDKETIKYSFKNIHTSDTVVFFTMVKKTPSNIRKFKINLTYNCNNSTKTITFDFKKIEFRTDSQKYKKYLQKKKHEKEKKESEENIWL